MSDYSKLYGEVSAKALENFYFKYGSTSVEQKINALQTVLGDSYFYGTGGNVSGKAILACLETEWLSNQGLLTLELA